MTYSFDPTGRALQNTVIGEEITLGQATPSNQLFVFFDQGPFFFDSVLIKHVPSTGSAKILNPGVDFSPGFQYFEATSKTNRYICSAVLLTDISLTGKLVVKYNCVGSSFAPTPTQLSSIRINEKRDALFTTWEQVLTSSGAAIPVFPLIEEIWQGIQSSTVDKAIEELSKLGLAVQIRPELLTEPTGVKFIPTKSEVGLGHVGNFPIATEQQAKLGTHNESYMTPLRVAQAIEADIVQKLKLIGYDIPTPYSAGLTLSIVNTAVSYDGSVYAPRQSALPFTTTGDFAVDKNKFVLLNTSNRDHWKSYNFTLTGNETRDPVSNLITINTGLVFDSDVDVKLIIYPVSELFRSIDFHLHKGILKLNYPCAAGDEFTLHYKRKSTLTACDRPYHHVVKISNGTRSFQLPDFDALEPDDLRVTLNDFVILSKTIDYDISPTGMLGVHFPLKLLDTLEVVNQDSLPIFGVLQTRSILYSIQ